MNGGRGGNRPDGWVHPEYVYYMDDIMTWDMAKKASIIASMQYCSNKMLL
jgi:hypothetical protein